MSAATSTLDGMGIRKGTGARSALLGAAHRSIREQGGDPSTSPINEPFDERGTATDG